MIQVYFYGYGDWFLKKNNTIIPITSKIMHGIDFQDNENPQSIVHWNTDLRRCSEFNGVFCISDNQAEILQYTEDYSHIKRMLPCLENDKSSFLKMVNDGKLSIDEAENCWFEIKTSNPKGYTHFDVNYTITEFHEDQKQSDASEIDGRERSSYLNTIGALLAYIKGINGVNGKPDNGIKTHPSYTNNKDLINLRVKSSQFL